MEEEQIFGVNFADIGTNLANAGTVQAPVSPDYDIETAFDSDFALKNRAIFLWHLFHNLKNFTILSM